MELVLYYYTTRRLGEAPRGCQKEKVLRRRDVHGEKGRGNPAIYMCRTKGVWNKFLSYDLAWEKGRDQKFANIHIGLAQ